MLIFAVQVPLEWNGLSLEGMSELLKLSRNEWDT